VPPSKMHIVLATSVRWRVGGWQSPDVLHCTFTRVSTFIATGRRNAESHGMGCLHSSSSRKNGRRRRQAGFVIQYERRPSPRAITAL